MLASDAEENHARRIVELMVWSLEQATRAATSALASVGCTAPLEALRFGGSAVFRSGGLVVRVAPATLMPLEAVAAAIELAAWLGRNGLAVARPAGTTGDAQTIDGSTVSLWHWEEATDATAPGSVHGTLLHHLHRLLDGYEGALPHSSCVAAVETRLRLASAHPRLAAEARQLRRAFERLATQLDGIAPALPPGPIHCDPHGGNVLRTARGWIVLDLDGVALGNREWDWASAARTHSGADRRHFAESYAGGDVEAWPGYDILLRLKLLDTLAWTAIHDGATGGTGAKVAHALAAYHDSGIRGG